jgi:hypothetical protein
LAAGSGGDYSGGGRTPRDKAAGIECPGEEEDSSPRRDLRERQLPWVYLSMIDDRFRGKALAGGRGGAVAC